MYSTKLAIFGSTISNSSYDFQVASHSKIDTAFRNTGYNWYDVNVFVAKVAKLYDRGFAILLTINTSICVANCWALCRVA